MQSSSRRQFGIALGTLALTPRARAAPFVPPRDPQVVAFAPGGTLVATGCSGLSNDAFPPRPHPNVRQCGAVAVWDVATRTRLHRWESFGDFTRLAFSPDGRLLAACRLFADTGGVELDEVRLWDVTTGRVVQVLDRCHCFDFAPDSRQLAVLSRSRCVLYDLVTWHKIRILEPLAHSISVSFTADGQSLIGIVNDHDRFRLRHVTIASGDIAAQSLALEQPFYTIAVSADSSLLATGHMGNIVLWDAHTLDVRSRWQPGFRGLAHPCFSPDGKTLAALAQDTGDVVLWNVTDRQELARYTFEKGAFHPHYNRPAGAIVCPERDPARVCFSPTGESFLTGCFGGIVRATTGGQELARFGE